MPLSKYNAAFGGKKGSAAKAHAAMAKEYGPEKGEGVFYAMKNKRMKSHMPSGATQSPKGDIGEMRQKEAGTMKGFKDAGPVKKTAGKFGSLTVNAAKDGAIS
jgi:hypothetical protein